MCPLTLACPAQALLDMCGETSGLGTPGPPIGSWRSRAQPLYPAPGSGVQVRRAEGIQMLQAQLPGHRRLGRLSDPLQLLRCKGSRWVHALSYAHLCRLDQASPHSC